jgi:hypothetical protein
MPRAEGVRACLPFMGSLMGSPGRLEARATRGYRCPMQLFDDQWTATLAAGVQAAA